MQICQEYPNEFLATPTGDLRCNFCDVLVKCHKKFFVESHRKVSNTKENWRRRTNLKVSKPFTTRSSKLQGTGCLFILSCRYSASQTETSHPSLKSLFAVMGKVLPSETTAQARVAKLASPKKNKFKNYFVTKHFFNYG